MVPGFTTNQLFLIIFVPLGKVREMQNLEDEEQLHCGIRLLKMEVPCENLDQILRSIETDEGQRFLVTVRGRQPKCLSCSALGHTRNQCHHTYKGQQQQ